MSEIKVLTPDRFRTQDPISSLASYIGLSLAFINPAFARLYQNRLAKHNQANLKLLARRDAVIRFGGETVRGNYATVFSNDPFFSFYKYTVGGKNYSLHELEKRIDTQHGRTADFFSVHEGTFGRWLNNGRKLTSTDIRHLKKSYHILEKKYKNSNPNKDFYLAVRSSGTLITPEGLPVGGGEDSKDNAFAGLNETLLNITSFEEMLKAIEYCFSQSGNDAVVSYMNAKGINPEWARLPLVVQEMVRSESFSDFAGIIFTRSKRDPSLGTVEIISGMNEYAVGGIASRYSFDFNPSTGEIVREYSTKQKRALLANKFRIGNIDTNIDISLPEIMSERFETINRYLEIGEYDDQFYELIKTCHLIKAKATNEQLIEIAQNYLEHRDEIMNLSHELDDLDNNVTAKPAMDYVNMIIQQAITQKQKFGIECDMEFVNNTFLQIRSLTGNAVAIEKGPDSKLPIIGNGMIASPGVVIGKALFVDTEEDMRRYREMAKTEMVIPVFPIADTKYTPVEADPNCPGAAAVDGTPNGHAGIIAGELAGIKPETGFAYIVGIKGPNGEMIRDYYDFASFLLNANTNNQNLITDFNHLLNECVGSIVDHNLSAELIGQIEIFYRGKINSVKASGFNRELLTTYEPENLLEDIKTQHTYKAAIECLKDMFESGIKLLVEKYSDITINCWSPNVGDGKIHAGQDAHLYKKWIDFWKNNQYSITEEVVKPNGTKIKMGAIVSIVEAVETVNKANYDYIGLFRLEELYRSAITDHRLPDDMNGVASHPFEFFTRNLDHILEDYIYKNLCKVVDLFPDKPITLRAMDFQLPDMRSLKFGDNYIGNEDEAGALIGKRGAYLFRENDRLFSLEARVIKRLLEYVKDKRASNTIKYMYPFFRAPSDAVLFEKLKREHGLEDSKDGLKLGIMLEVASNIAADALFKEVAAMYNGVLPFSFGSIGMNDLEQFFLARYRNEPSLLEAYSNDRYFMYESAIPPIVDACNKYGIDLSTCGDAAGKDPKVTQFFYDLGIKNIGVSPAYLGIAHQRLLKFAEADKQSTKFVVPLVSKLEV